MSQPKEVKLSDTKINAMREWKVENGQCVRQLTVRNMSNKDHPGTLPLNCYLRKLPDVHELDFSKLKVDVQETDKIHPLDFVECTTERSETFIVESVIEIILLHDFQGEDDVIVVSEDSYYACMTKVCIGSDMNDVTLQEEVEMDLEEESATNVARLLMRAKRKRKPRSDTDFMFY
ncbi:Hypothetical predicted protein [Mytilus galloprovincialis]|uniref:Uncharacterized protein n=1 Tax=Mytilus galloprovincialis TaxID=29158 RepID=A0A8B6EFF6_MYTGA|nr:Hypothetical predicted protein [Mytilus galloprovincialis]